MTSFDSTTKPTGRTGWDVLISSKLFILILLIGIIAIVLLLIYKDSLTGLSTQFDILIETYQDFLIPPIAGLILGRYIYRRYLLNGIILLVVPLDKPTRCIRMSRDTFATYTKENGLCNPESTHYGESLYHIKSIDFENKIIDGGWIHNKDQSPIVLLTLKDELYAWIKDYRKKSRRIVELHSVPFIEGTEHGMAVVKKDIDLLQKAILGESAKDVESSTEEEEETT